MTSRDEDVVTVFDDNRLLTLSELCRACHVDADFLHELVAEGVIDPAGGGASASWRFEAITIRRVRRIQHLRRDLGVNLAGAALALELLDEIDRLTARLRRWEDI